MPKLLIRRNSEWANKMRSFELYINGVKFSEISDKQVLSFELPEGTYRLQAKIDWCGSRPVDFKLQEGETKRIEITGFLFSKYLFPVAIATVLIYIAGNLLYARNSLFLGTLMMIYFGYFLYFISFGRNDYLQIKER